MDPSSGYVVKAYADYFTASGKVGSTVEARLNVRLKDAQPVPKSGVVIEKPGKYESFLWKNDTFATYTIKPGNGSYQVTVPEGWVFGVMVRDDNGKYIEENAYRTCRFTFDKEDSSKRIWISREDHENNERRFWVEVTETFNQDVDYVPETVTAPYAETMHVTKYNIEQLTFTPTASGIYEMKLDNENVEYLVTDGDMSNGEYEILKCVAVKSDVESRYLEKGKTYNIYFQTKQKDEEINFSLKAGDTLTFGSDLSKTVDRHCILTFVPQEDGDYSFEIDTTEEAIIRYTTETYKINDLDYAPWTYGTLKNLKAGVPCYIYIRLDNTANITCRIVKA